MRITAWALALGGFTAVAAVVVRADGPEANESRSAPTAAAVFERFKSLEGRWLGKSTKGWTDEVSYKTIAAGSCVMETSFGAHPNETMATMVHLDGERLMLTHYCVAKNQPRLLATEFGADGSTVTFTFLDGTSMPKGRDTGHMDKVVFAFHGPDEFTSRWTWYELGKENWMEEIRHSRIKDDPVAGSPSSAPANAPPSGSHQHH